MHEGSWLEFYVVVMWGENSSILTMTKKTTIGFAKQLYAKLVKKDELFV